MAIGCRRRRRTEARPEDYSCRRCGRRGAPLGRTRHEWFRAGGPPVGDADGTRRTLRKRSRPEDRYYERPGDVVRASCVYQPGATRHERQDSDRALLRSRLALRHLLDASGSPGTTRRRRSRPLASSGRAPGVRPVVVAVPGPTSRRLWCSGTTMLDLVVVHQLACERALTHRQHATIGQRPSPGTYDRLLGDGPAALYVGNGLVRLGNGFRFGLFRALRLNAGVPAAVLLPGRRSATSDVDTRAQITCESVRFPRCATILDQLPSPNLSTAAISCSSSDAVNIVLRRQR